MSVLTVHIRATVLAVRIELGPPEHAGILEGLVIEAVGAGVDNINELSNIFGLPPRMMLDLLSDLWRDDRISVDFGEKVETIRLTPKGLVDLSQREADSSVKSSQRPFTTSQVLLDPLTGRVLPRRQPRSGWVDRSLIIPPMDDDFSINDVRPEALGAAVRREFEMDPGGDITRVGQQKVVAAHLVPRLVSSPADQRTIALEVSVATGDLDELQIEVTDEALTIEEREVATRRLQGFVDYVPHSAFVRALRGRASRHLELPRTFQDQLRELAKAASSLASSAPANRQSQHAQVDLMASGLMTHARALAQREMMVRVVTADGHEDAIIRLLDSARLQVVLVVPWLSRPGMRHYVEALQRAVHRGVRIILLWGIRNAGEELNEQVLRELNYIREQGRQAGRGGDLLFHPTRPSHTHAKVVIVDDRAALVTSKNYFSAAAADQNEVGLVVEALEGRTAPVLEDLLRWAHVIAPDHELGQQIVKDRDAFGARVMSEPHGLPALPAFVPELTTAERGDPAVELWAGAWQSAATELASALTRPLPVVRAMTDGMHPALLRDAMRESNTRLLVTSDKFSSRVVTPDVISNLEERARSGVSVSLVHKGFGSDAEADRASSQRLVDGRAVALTRDEKNHAKVIVSDELVIVGSYNFLSLESDNRRRRFSGELSLHVLSTEISNTVGSLFGIAGMPPTAVKTAHRNSRAAVAAAEISRLARAAPLDLEKIAYRASAAGIAGVLSALAEAEDVEAREVALAAVILSEGADEAARAERIGELAASAWRRRDWTLAHLLRGAASEGPGVPSAGLAAAVAAEPAAMADRLLESIVDEVPPPAALAIALHSTLARLELGDYTLDEPIRLLRGTLPDSPLTSVIDYALEYAGTFGILPRSALRRYRANRVNADLLSDRWQDIAVAVARLRVYDPATPPGRAAMDLVFADNGDMGLLEAIVADRDPARLLEWKSVHGSAPDGRWIEEAARRAGFKGVDGRRHESFVNKRAAIRVAVDALLEIADGAMAVGEDLERQLPNLEGLSAAAGRALEALEVAGLEGPEHVVIRNALERMYDIEGEAEPREVAWRFPGLRIAQMDGVEPGDLARALIVIGDVVEVREPGDEVAALVRRGEFTLAEEAVEFERSQLAGGVDELADLIETERVVAREALALDEVRLRVEAERSSLAEPEFPWNDGAALSRVSALRRLITAAEERLDGDRRARAADITAQLVSRSGMAPRWREYIKTLIEEGELSAALDAMTSDDGSVAVALSRTSRSWPFRNHTLAEVVYFFDNPGDRPSVVSEFDPPVEDEAGRAFIDALRALARGDGDAEQQYVTAVQMLVFETETAPTIRDVEGGRVARFVLPVPGELPRLAWAGSTVDVAIGDSAASALFRLSLDMNESLAPGAVVDIADVLSLLRLSSAERRTDDRRLNLVRVVCSKMGLDDVLDPHALGPIDSPIERSQLRWLLFVLGIDIDPTAIGVLAALGGSHPPVLHTLIARLMELRETNDPVREMRSDPGIGRLVVESVLEREVGSDGTRLVLAALSIAGDLGVDYESLKGFIEDAVRGASQYRASSVPPPDELVSLDAELELLIAHRYVSASDGTYRLIADFVGRALLRHDFDAALDLLVTSVIDTHLHGPLGAKISSAVERLLVHNQSDEMFARMSDAKFRDELMNSDIPADLKFFAGEESTFWSDAVVSVVVDPLEPAYVDGPPGRMLLILDTLMRNATHAVTRQEAAHPTGVGTIRIGVELRDGDSIIVVADSGSGIDDSVVAALRAGEAPHSSKRKGVGTGLALVHEIVQSMGGDVTIATDPHLGGASVTIRLPSREGPRAADP